MLCWLVLGRLFLPVDSASPYSLRGLWDSIFSVRVEPITQVGEWLEPMAMQSTPIAGVISTPFYEYLLWFIWGGVAVLYFARGILQRRYLRQQSLRAVEPIPCELQRLLQTNRALFGIRRPVTLVISSNAHFAFTLGSFQPILVLPRHAIECSQDDAHAILAHELAHIARWDDLKIVTLLAIRSVFFFFPVVWWCQYYLMLAREQACDRAVLCKTSIAANRYGDCLLRVLERQSEAQQPRWVNSLTAFASMRARINHLYGGNVVKPRRPAVNLGIFCLLGAVIWPMASFQQTINTHAAGFAMPVTQARLSSAFGLRTSPLDGTSHFHYGVDLAGDAGQSVYSVAAGQVLIANSYTEDKMPQSGNYIVIAHTNGMQSRYTHLERVLVVAGEFVAKGEPIGSMGATGRATGPHLHLEITENGEYVDPQLLIGFEVGALSY